MARCQPKGVRPDPCAQRVPVQGKFSVELAVTSPEEWPKARRSRSVADERGPKPERADKARSAVLNGACGAVQSAMFLRASIFWGVTRTRSSDGTALRWPYSSARSA